MADEIEQAVPQAEPPSQPQEDLATLKVQLEEATKNFQKAQEEAKSHQASAVKSAQRLKEAEDFRTEIREVNQKIDILADYISSNPVSQTSPDEDTPKTVPRTPPKVEFQKRSRERALELAQRAGNLATGVGLKFDTVEEASPELLRAINLFLTNRPEAGLAEVERIVEEKKKVNTPAPTPVPEKKELTEEEEAEIARKYLEKKNALKTDTGSPSGASRDWKSIKKAYADGNISTMEYEAEAKKRGVSL